MYNLKKTRDNMNFETRFERIFVFIHTSSRIQFSIKSKSKKKPLVQYIIK